MKIEKNLYFNLHATSLCKKAWRKLAVLATLSKFMSLKQKRILMKTFIEFQFGYCPLVWIFHSRKTNSNMNQFQERSVKMVYNDYITSSEDWLKKSNSFKTHHKNIKSFAIEFCKVKKGLASPFSYDIFPPRSIDFNFRSQTNFFVSSFNVSD